MVTKELGQLALRAKQLYDLKLRDELEKTHRDAFIAIEPNSETYFMGSTMRQALSLAEQAYPNRLFHVIRIGHEAAIHVGKLET
jgi:hypothetical protein